MAVALLAAACGPARPAPGAWMPLAEFRDATISYSPASVQRQPDGTVVATIALDHAVPQTFQETTYTRHEMLVQVDCDGRRAGSTDYRLYAGGREVRAGTNSPGWHNVRPVGYAESHWFPALCLALVASPAP
jgi:hypothetical protein